MTTNDNNKEVRTTTTRTTRTTHDTTTTHNTHGGTKMARKARFSKTCTKSGVTYTADTQEGLAEFFYRDKSQKDGLAPWSKDAERAYNKAYRAALSEANVVRKRDADATGVAAFDTIMAPERVERKKGTKNNNERATSRAASKARTTTRARARKDKDTTTGKATTTKKRTRRAKANA